MEERKPKLAKVIFAGTLGLISALGIKKALEEIARDKNTISQEAYLEEISKVKVKNKIGNDNFFKKDPGLEASQLGGFFLSLLEDIEEIAEIPSIRLKIGDIKKLGPSNYRELETAAYNRIVLEFLASNYIVYPEAKFLREKFKKELTNQEPNYDIWTGFKDQVFQINPDYYM